MMIDIKKNLTRSLIISALLSLSNAVIKLVEALLVRAYLILRAVKMERK